jgi:hypothetical protein
MSKSRVGHKLLLESMFVDYQTQLVNSVYWLNIVQMSIVFT